MQKLSYDKIEAITLQCVMNGSCHGSNFLWPPILKLSFDEPLMYSCCVLCVIVKVQHGGISRPSRGLSLSSLYRHLCDLCSLMRKSNQKSHNIRPEPVLDLDMISGREGSMCFYGRGGSSSNLVNYTSRKAARSCDLRNLLARRSFVHFICCGHLFDNHLF